MPDYLVRPPIDEVFLMKMKAQQKVRPETGGRGGPTKKMSLAAQKAEQAFQKSKNEINVKIRRAELNLKLFFGELKKVLEKPDEDMIFPDLPMKVENAKLAEKNTSFVTFMFKVYSDYIGDDRCDTRRVTKTQFVQFIRNYLRSANENQATDMYMFLNKKL